MNSPIGPDADVFVHPQLVIELQNSVGVVRFSEGASNGIIPLREYEKPIRALAQRDDCKIVEFDLDGVTHMPSGMLGTMISLIRNERVNVRVRNASDEVREAMMVTRLNRTIPIVS